MGYPGDPSFQEATGLPMGKAFFDKLRDLNVRRCNEYFNHGVIDWSPTDWGCAVAGEVGELCNLLKKARRGDFNFNEQPRLMDVRNEIADVFIYLDLLAARLNIDLRDAIIDKFNEVSRKRGAPYFL